MPAERKAPAAILAITNLVGAVAAIKDDPDTPDANWLVASDNNSNTDVRVSFSPSVQNLTVGANLQEFRVLVRQFDEGQSGTPQARIELWDDGALVRAGADIAVPVGGVVLSLPWNASEIANSSDGETVQCKVVGTKAGGGPTVRNSVDVGAVEWNANVQNPAQPIVSDLLDLMPDTVTAQPGVLDGRGNFTNVGSVVSFKARIEGRNRLIRDATGREVVSSVQVIVGGVYGLTTTKHRYTLPDRFLPRLNLRAIGVQREADESGPHHEVVFFP